MAQPAAWRYLSAGAWPGRAGLRLSAPSHRRALERAFTPGPRSIVAYSAAGRRLSPGRPGVAPVAICLVRARLPLRSGLSAAPDLAESSFLPDTGGPVSRNLDRFCEGFRADRARGRQRLNRRLAETAGPLGSLSRRLCRHLLARQS